MPGSRIGDRAKSLSPKTIARIEAGLRKYGPEPYLTVNREGTRNIAVRTAPVPTVVAAPNAIGLVVPVQGRDGKQATATHEPMRTMTTRAETALVVPSGGTWRESATSTGEPFGAVTTRETDALVVPYYGSARAASSTDGPIGTLTTKDRYGVAFITELRGGRSD